MAATNRSKDDLINESTGLYKDNTAGDISASDLRDGIFSIFQPQGICQGRLTLESGVPVSTTDQTAKTTIYFTPYNGNCIGLYDGTSWKLHTFTERSLALGTLTSGLNYDVFIYDNAGTLTLELTAWTNDTTRATALTTQDGVYVKTGATTRRYLGTLRTTSTTTTEDSGGSTSTSGKRFLWNLYNQVDRRVQSKEGGSHTYSTATWRQYGADAAMDCEFIQGLALSKIQVTVRAQMAVGGTYSYLAAGLDTTTTNTDYTAIGAVSIDTLVGVTVDIASPTVGYHYMSLNQIAQSSTAYNFGAVLVTLPC
jgi:hypothetical protein